METRQGKIEEKFLKFAANKAAYATFKIDGKNYNTFDKEIIDNHNPDDFVEFTGEQGDRFWTLKTMKKIDKLDPHLESEFAKGMPKNGAKEFHLTPEKIRIGALECALVHTNNRPWNEILEIADKFVEWIRNGN